MAQYTWEEAMSWWKNSGDFEPLIRNAAVTLLDQNTEEGFGIGSSDVNHEVFHMYSHYLSYKAYCEEREKEVNMVDFLMDVLADVA
jgi:hypothetical protein